MTMMILHAAVGHMLRAACGRGYAHVSCLHVGRMDTAGVRRPVCIGMFVCRLGLYGTTQAVTVSCQPNLTHAFTLSLRPPLLALILTHLPSTFFV